MIILIFNLSFQLWQNVKSPVASVRPMEIAQAMEQVNSKYFSIYIDASILKYIQ